MSERCAHWTWTVESHHLSRNQPILGQKSIDDKFTIIFSSAISALLFFREKTRRKNIATSCVLPFVCEKKRKQTRKKKLVKENIQRKIFTRINYFLSGENSIAWTIKRSANYSRDIVSWSSPHLSSCVLIPSICSPFYTNFFLCFYICENLSEKNLFSFSFFKKERKSRVFSPLKTHFPSFLLIFTETMTKTSSEVQQKGDRIIKTTTTEGERRAWKDFNFQKVWKLKIVSF